jgi:hypothetical protein
MSIIAASHYRNGKRIGPVSLDQPVRCATDRSEFVWIGLFEPSVRATLGSFQRTRFRSGQEFGAGNRRGGTQASRL